MDTEDYKLYLLDFDNNVGPNQSSEEVQKRAAAIKGMCTVNAYWKVLTRLKYDETALMQHVESKSATENAKLFQFGISCMTSFLQANFTGPDLDENAEAFLKFDKYPPMDYNKKLAINNDEVNVNTRFACLLVAAKLIFKVFQEKSEYRLLSRWWRWRSIIIHQQVLDEMSPTLLTVAESVGRELDAIATNEVAEEATEEAETGEQGEDDSSTTDDNEKDAGAKQQQQQQQQQQQSHLRPGERLDISQVESGRVTELLTEDRNRENLPKPMHLDVYLSAKLHLERAQLYILYRRTARAAHHLTTAQTLLGLTYSFVGALGRRTRHQSKPLAQLALDIQLTAASAELGRPDVHEESDADKLPRKLELKDDVRLERVVFEEEDGKERVRLPNLEQQFLVVRMQQEMTCRPKDDVYHEELGPLFEEILGNKNTWPVRYATLHHRCQHEQSHKRTVDRSFMQYEELLNALRRPQPAALHRVGGAYTLGIPPTWTMGAHYGRIMMNLGLVKSALDTFVRVQLWEEVIVCHTLLEQRLKAAQVIRERLVKDPGSIRLHCWLGDCLKDEACYETAWELSKKRSHRAQRHWGLHHFHAKEYEKCIPHLEKSVSINPLQASVWSRLGFAALETKNWQVAATAYRRYTTLEPDGFDAWNNLAQAYIKLGNKRSAHHALTEALRCNYDNWRIWENFLVVSADIGQYSDIIRAYQRLLDLREKYLNTDVLGVLVRGIFENANDAEGRPTEPLMKKTRELLGRITGIFPGEGLLWEGYALLSSNSPLRLLRLQRAFRAYTQAANWTSNAKHCAMVLNVCQGLAEIALNDTAFSPDDTCLHSVRLALTTAVVALQRRNHAETRELLAHVAEQLGKLLRRMNITVNPAATATAPAAVGAAVAPPVAAQVNTARPSAVAAAAVGVIAGQVREDAGVAAEQAQAHSRPVSDEAAVRVTGGDAGGADPTTGA